MGKAIPTKGAAAPKVMYSPFAAKPVVQTPAAPTPAAALAGIEPLLIPEPMLIEPMALDIEPFSPVDELTLKSIKVDGQELIKPEPEKCENDHNLNPESLQTQTSTCTVVTVASVQVVKTSVDSPPSTSPVETDVTDVLVEYPEDDASISAAINNAHVGEPMQLPEEDIDDVEVSVHMNEASISAAVYDVARNGDDTEVEVSEHMNEESISAAVYEGREEL